MSDFRMIPENPVSRPARAEARRSPEVSARRGLGHGNITADQLKIKQLSVKHIAEKQLGVNSLLENSLEKNNLA